MTFTYYSHFYQYHDTCKRLLNVITHTNSHTCEKNELEHNIFLLLLAASRQRATQDQHRSRSHVSCRNQRKDLLSRPTSMFVNIRQSPNCEQFHRNSWTILILSDQFSSGSSSCMKSET